MLLPQSLPELHLQSFQDAVDSVEPPFPEPWLDPLQTLRRLRLLESTRLPPYVELQRALLCLYRKLAWLLVNRGALAETLNKLVFTFRERLLRGISFMELLQTGQGHLETVFVNSLVALLETETAEGDAETPIVVRVVGHPDLTQLQVATLTVQAAKARIQRRKGRGLRSCQQTFASELSPYQKLRALKRDYGVPMVIVLENCQNALLGDTADETAFASTRKQSFLYCLADMLHEPGLCAMGVCVCVRNAGAFDSLEGKIRSRLPSETLKLPTRVSLAQCDAFLTLCHTYLHTVLTLNCLPSTLHTDLDTLIGVLRQGLEAALFPWPELTQAPRTVLHTLGNSLQEVIGWVPFFPLEPSHVGGLCLFTWSRAMLAGGQPNRLVATPATPVTPTFSPRRTSPDGLLHVIHSSQKRTRTEQLPVVSPTTRRSKRRKGQVPASPISMETEPTTATEKPYPTKQVAAATPFATPGKTPFQTPVSSAVASRSARTTPLTKLRDRQHKYTDYDLQGRMLGWINLSLLDHLLLATFCGALRAQRRVVTPGYLVNRARLSEYAQRACFATAEFGRLSKIFAVDRLLQFHVLMISTAQYDFQLPPPDEHERGLDAPATDKYSMFLSFPLLFPFYEQYGSFLQACQDGGFLPKWLRIPDQPSLHG
eukprot:Gregarina_sp_Pseudo_9__5571@NODE_749_length_2273_cov_11_934199_g705_i0_p1_GENE_NODE_749_length_2273_cov_11_934199_g705_i0NODE_749_length_2273_cov_11_934199_g705_i0_p1_ORF_typecomplete_len655_score188_02_NODE_749_length_2273_cov_11_934199_g705_i01802144